MQNFTSFNDLAETTTNAPTWDVGGTPHVAAVQPIPSQLPPPDPQWRKTVDERLGNLEKNMATKTEVANLKTEMMNGFAEVKQSIAKIEQTLTKK